MRPHYATSFIKQAENKQDLQRILSLEEDLNNHFNIEKVKKILGLYEEFLVKNGIINQEGALIFGTSNAMQSLDITVFYMACLHRYSMYEEDVATDNYDTTAAMQQSCEQTSKNIKSLLSQLDTHKQLLQQTSNFKYDELKAEILILQAKLFIIRAHAIYNNAHSDSENKPSFSKRQEILKNFLLAAKLYKEAIEAVAQASQTLDIEDYQIFPQQTLGHIIASCETWSEHYLQKSQLQQATYFIKEGLKIATQENFKTQNLLELKEKLESCLSAKATATPTKKTKKRNPRIITDSDEEDITPNPKDSMEMDNTQFSRNNSSKQKEKTITQKSPLKRLKGEASLEKPQIRNPESNTEAFYSPTVSTTPAQTTVNELQDTAQQAVSIDSSRLSVNEHRIFSPQATRSSDLSAKLRKYQFKEQAKTLLQALFDTYWTDSDYCKDIRLTITTAVALFIMPAQLQSNKPFHQKAYQITVTLKAFLNGSLIRGRFDDILLIKHKIARSLGNKKHEIPKPLFDLMKYKKLEYVDFIFNCLDELSSMYGTEEQEEKHYQDFYITLFSSVAGQFSQDGNKKAADCATQAVEKLSQNNKAHLSPIALVTNTFD